MVGTVHVTMENFFYVIENLPVNAVATNELMFTVLVQTKTVPGIWLSSDFHGNIITRWRLTRVAGRIH